MKTSGIYFILTLMLFFTSRCDWDGSDPCDKLKVEEKAKTFTITLTSNINIQDEIEKGKYSWHHYGNNDKIEALAILEAILEQQKASGKKVEIELKHFAKKISTEDVLKKLNYEGYRPATTRELLALIAEDPEELHGVYPIVALPTKEEIINEPVIFKGRPCVPYAWWNGFEYKIRLAWISPSTVWEDYFRFPAVRNK